MTYLIFFKWFGLSLVGSVALIIAACLYTFENKSVGHYILHDPCLSFCLSFYFFAIQFHVTDVLFRSSFMVTPCRSRCRGTFSWMVVSDGIMRQLESVLWSVN